MGHLIQNGRTIKFWTDNLQNLGPVRNLISGPLLQHEESLLLNECWDHNGSWCFDKLSMTLPPSITNIIMAVPRPFFSPLDDGLCWQPSSNGLFNSSSAYKIALNLDQPPPPTSCWRWIWKLNTLPCIAFFVWQLCHERLPTKTLLSQRKIISNNLCPLCHSNPESCLHLFRDFPSILPLWHSLRDGLILAHQLNIKKIIIELDAKAVLDLVHLANFTSISHHPYGALITDCRSLIQDFEEANLQHTFREGNAIADLLAKAGKSLLCPFVLFDDPPLFAVSQVLADCRGVKYPRLV
jgi:hypothetical protein